MVGPSAGIGMVTSIVSTLSGIAVRPDVAMTGEVTLRGKILPVGGIKEKVLAARRAGVERVVLPESNKQDIDEIQADLLVGLDICYVGTIEDALTLTLSQAPISA